QGRKIQIHALLTARYRISRGRRDQCPADVDPLPGRFPTFDRQDALFDGTARRSLLLERTSARDGWKDPACGGDRWASPGALRGGAGDQGEDQSAGDPAAE